MTPQEYRSLVYGMMDKLKDQIILPNSPDSQVLTRYITSAQGQNDEQWIASMRSPDGKCNIWLLTVMGLVGVPEGQRDTQSIGTFTKPIQVACDFFYDYTQGRDYTEDNNNVTLTTNSEREFLDRVLAVDLALEQRKGCLDSNTFIESWSFRQKIRRFSSATAHWNNGVINLELQDLAL